MSTILEIEVDPISLDTKLTLSESIDGINNELKLILSSLSENFNYNNYAFHVPWFDLRRGISSIAQIIKMEGLIVKYDHFTEELLHEIISDRNSLKSKLTAIKLSEVELVNILNIFNFNRRLTNEQKRDVLHLLEYKHGANFSVPGAGKTTTTLSIHFVLKHLKIITKLFVVAPINAFMSWEEEINSIFTDNPISILRLQRNHLDDYSYLKQDNPDVVLVNYEKLRKDVKQLIPFFIDNKVHLILDESHRVKSGLNNISYNQIIKLADLSKRRDILSGTPMPQSYLDLEPQFDFLWPGEMIIPTQQINSSDKDKTANFINRAIEGLYVRTTKNELGLEYPIINYKIIPMGRIQSELYRLFKSEAARTIARIDKPNIYHFRKIGRSVVKLLQAASNPILLTANDDYNDEILSPPPNKELWELLGDFQKYEKPVKIEYLKSRVRDITNENRNNKIVIWSYFVRNILILENILKEYNPVSIYGAIPSGSDEDEAKREGRIKIFHEDHNCRVLIANPQACGEGISLHKVCHHAIYLDRNFNSAYFLQSVDRIHRLGLEKGIKTYIEILVADDSIDKTLIKRLDDKIVAMSKVLEDTYLQSLAYDPADINSDDENGIDIKDFEAIKKHVTENEETS